MKMVNLRNKTSEHHIVSDSETSDSSDNTESIHETNHGSFKGSRNDRLKGQIRRRRAIEEKSSTMKQCAVMYKNEEPVGILQPYKDSYQFLPIHSDEQIPVDISPFADVQNSMKRDTSLKTEDDEDSPELGDETLKKGVDSSQYSDDRYPYIFAKFKVDSRVEKPDMSGSKQRTLHKRESMESLIDEKRSDSLRSTLSKIQSNDEGAEVELRNILSDMGLIDDRTPQHVDKREAELNEDEDLEHGTNKINLIRLDNSEERSKREDVDEDKRSEEVDEDKKAEEVDEEKKREVVDEDRPVKRSDTVTKHDEAVEISEQKAKTQEEEYIDQYLNKNEDQTQEQAKKELEKRSDDAAAQMEKEIKSKLQRIKEEVRSEIEKIKGGNNEEFEDDWEDDEEQEQENEKSLRKKRHVISSLVDEETRDIDPVLNADNSLVPHIRRIRKRSLTDEDVSVDDPEESVKEFKMAKNEPQLAEPNSENPIEGKNKMNSADLSSRNVIDSRTETNFVIDLYPEIDTSQKPSSLSRHKRKIYMEESELDVNRNDNSKGDNDHEKISVYQEGERSPESFEGKSAGNSKITPLILDRLTELENLELGVKNVGSEPPTGKSITPTNQYYATTEKHYLTRNLKQYDEEPIDDDESINEDDNVNVKETNEANVKIDENNDKSLNREERNCKCSNGDKDCKCGKSSDDGSNSNDNSNANSEENNEENNLDKDADINRDTDAGIKRDKKNCKCTNGDGNCKCGKAPLRLLKGTDGVNFVYIDDVPRLADGPPIFKEISSEKESDDTVKIKLRPILPDKKRAAKENIDYHKTVLNFAKNLRDGGYTLDIDPDVYRITEENSKTLQSRRKRDSFADLVAIHGGGPIMDHLIAIRERSMLPRIRVKRSEDGKDQTDHQLTLTDMSGEDLFGALPQGFQEELGRFKRVKRAS